MVNVQTSGGDAFYITGLFGWMDAPNVLPILIPFFFMVASVFLINLSFFGFVSQFIYRFQTLTRING